MTGLRTHAVRTIGRSSVGVLSVAVALLLMGPVAGATPDSDAADTAITQAWTADGGADGELGDKDGDVYRVGEGYGQNFASGKIYYTQRTGAHYVLGAVLDKYQSLGGPADSDLGFPTADEGAGKAEGSRDSTFNAADDPVIFWTPDNGAWVVRGAINAAWDKLGGSAGTLGIPTADETWKGGVVSQSFTGGQISWDSKSKTFTTSPSELAGQLTGLDIPGNATTAIAAARRAAGGPSGPLGTEEGAQYKVGDKGVGQNYAGGAIFYSPETGAGAVTGPLLAKYRAAGGPQGDLGFPTGSEADGGVLPTSRMVTFAAPDQPVIFWTPDHGAFIVRGAMNLAWAKVGGATGKLGAPTGDESVGGDVVSQKFTGGSISWDSSTGVFTADPADLTGQLAGLKVPKQGLVKARSAAGHGSNWHQFHWWWLLAIIPLVLAIGAIVIAAILRRRRHAEQARDDDEFGTHDDFADDGRQDYPGGHDGEYREDYLADERYGDEYGVPGHYDDGPQQFQDDPDSVDTAPNAIANSGADGHPGLEVPEHHGPGWAGLGAGPGAAGLGAADAIPDDQPADDEFEGDDFEGAERDADAQLTETGVEAHGDEAGHEADASVTPEVSDEPEIPAESGFGAAARLFGRRAGGRDRGAADPDEPVSRTGDAESVAPDVEQTAEATRPDAAPEVESSAEPEPEPELASGPASGRHHAAHVEEPETAQMSFRVAFKDGSNAPAGYTIKADTKSGQYWVPGSPGYDSAPAEIWFASEDFAITNGFIKG
jgi:uncharacterized protein with LGFP repeats